MTFRIKSVREVEPAHRPLPQVLSTIGQPPPTGLQVFLSRQAEEKILLAAPLEQPSERLPDLARTFLGENECGGLLIGNVYQAEAAGYRVTFTAIVDAIPAQEAQAGPTFVEMGATDLLAVTNYLQRLREHQRNVAEADLRIVGWYHTHPGFGVFMSGTDQATQRQVFGMPWRWPSSMIRSMASTACFTARTPPTCRDGTCSTPRPKASLSCRPRQRVWTASLRRA